MPLSYRASRSGAVLAALGLVVASGPSEAAPPPFPAMVVSGPQSATTGFPPGPVLTIQGQALTLTNTDLTNHNITSTATNPVRVKYGKKFYTIRVPLFRSESVPSGGQKDVKGVVNLKPGSYAFLCSLHTAMKGTLMVQAGG